MNRTSLLVLLALAPLAPAQEQPRPDPFATPPPMRRAARGTSSGGGDVAGVTTTSGLEAVAVRGLLLLRDRPAAALLEVEGQVLVVRAGDQVAHLTVVAIDAAGVVLRTQDGTTAQVRL